MRLKPGSEAFRVTELPTYAPAGEGEHLYLEVEKRGVTTQQVARALAEVCGVPTSAVGFAGRKDRHAVARQWFSVRGGKESALEGLAERVGEGGAEVVQASRHRNKLRLGHLRGNRFELRLEGDGDVEGLSGRLAARAERGFPNRFGPQRFGVGGSTLTTARAWGAGEPARGDRRHRQLVASAAQSAVFNAVLDGREEAGLTYRLRVGDLALRPGGRPFRVREEEVTGLSEEAAPGRLLVLTTGPLPGSSRLTPDAAIDEQERRWSEGTGVDWSWFERRGPLESRGDRRALVAHFLESPEIESEPGGAWVRFALPRGCYATELLASVGVELPEDRGDRD